MKNGLNKTSALLVVFWMIILCGLSTGYADSVAFESDKWVITAKQYSFDDYLGRESLLLECSFPEDCFAIVSNSEFQNGIIEFDVLVGREEGQYLSRERGIFYGAVWRLQDYENYEEFFFRPNAYWRADVNQYMPVINGSTGLQLYYGYGAPFDYVLYDDDVGPFDYSRNKWVQYKYKIGAKVEYPFDEWVHVKMVVSQATAEVYVIDMEEPALFIPELKRATQSGNVGIKVDYGKARFSNFSYVNFDNPPMNGSAKEMEAVSEGTIMAWLVSDAFDEQVLDQKHQISTQDKAVRTWSALESERSGLANLARVQGVEKTRNSVFARINVVSETAQVKRLDFGFSDRVKVYLNDQLIFAGNNNYGTRDYRFLGTIGFFDELYLPLKKGKNELWMAVSETFGGWGVQARFTDMDGISIVERPAR